MIMNGDLVGGLRMGSSYRIRKQDYRSTTQRQSKSRARAEQEQSKSKARVKQE